MCGRFTLRSDPAAIAALFRLGELPSITARYNIAPTQSVGCVLPEAAGERWTLARWGLLARWQGNAPASHPLINARSESVSQKPSFRSAFLSRRCLIPCDGFFEWQMIAGSRRKRPWWITVGQGELTAFAGLYEVQEDGTGPARISCCLLTTEANALVAPVHHRMPVLIDREHHNVWLGGTPEAALGLLRPYPAEPMRRVPVDFAVGNPRHESPDCVLPVDTPVVGYEVVSGKQAVDEASSPSIRN
jgi:putative SOS response-associated peptidase YedK